MRALITGAAGQLGSDLRNQLEAFGEKPVALTRTELDIADPEAVHQALADTAPDVVFNCAAFHNVEECERSEDQASAINVRAVKRLGQDCAELGAKLVHFSTNYVFDGTADAPYTERDLPQPRSIYAITKHAGEHAAMAYAPRALVVRTAGLYGLAGSAAKGGNFVQRMLGRAQAGEPIRMVADQRLTPTYTADLAAASIDAARGDAAGLMHLTNSGECSWHEFTEAILTEAGVEAEVQAVTTTLGPGAAQRPLNGVLARGAADAMGLRPLRGWREALVEYMRSAGLAPSS